MHSNLRACWYTTVSFSAYNSLLDRITMLFQSATKAVNKAIEKSVAKARKVIQTKRNGDYYWIASKISFGRENVVNRTYFPCMSISQVDAARYVRREGDVFSRSKDSARRLAININGAPPVGPERHGTTKGYFYHYHARKRIGAGRGGGHIFYL